MIAQEAKVPTDASGELLVSTPSTPEGAAEFLAQTGIGDARDGEGRIAEGLEQQTVFATEIQSADPAAVLSTEVRGRKSEVSWRGLTSDLGSLSSGVDLGAQGDPEVRSQRSEVSQDSHGPAVGMPQSCL